MSPPGREHDRGAAHEAPLTPGELPRAALSHPHPTTIGLIDLERSACPQAPGGGPCSLAGHDMLVLVRVHGEPLALVHVPAGVLAHGEHAVAEHLWAQAAPWVRRHARCFSCMSPAAERTELTPAPSCPGSLPAPSPSVAIILCTAGRTEQLERCVTSLLAQSVAGLELIVVDNRPELAGTRRAIELAATRDQRVRYVPEPRVGLSNARNRGVAETDADVVAFTDDDVVVDPTWLAWLTDAFSDPAVLASCGMVLPLELSTVAQKQFEDFGGFCKGLELCSYDRSIGQGQGRMLYPFMNGVVGTGNSMAFRRAELLAGGGFDPALGAGSPARAGEETWAFGRAILEGGRIVYQPRALCWHEHRHDTPALLSQVEGYGSSVGALLTRAMISDPRFYLSALGGAGVLLARRLDPRPPLPDMSRAASRSAEMERARLHGMLRGPLRYLRGRRRSRR